MTRLEPNYQPRSDRPMIHVEVTTFYADAPVVPGSIARAIERARNGEAPVDGVDHQARNDGRSLGDPRPMVSVESAHAVRPHDRMSSRREPHVRPAYTPSHSGPYTPSNQPYESTTSPSLAALQDRSTTPSSRLPLTLPRSEEDAVYRRMNHSESSRANGWHPEAARDPRQPRFQDRYMPGDNPASVRNIKRDNHPRPQPVAQIAQRANIPHAGPAAPPTLPRSGLVQPLPPSQFTAQMHIPSFRTGVGQE